MRLRTEARRQAILNAAARVFMEIGYERASMAEIAARVGGSKATLYGYFPSKEDLFMKVVLNKLGKQLKPAFNELPSLAHEAPRTVLTKFGEVFIGTIITPDATAITRLIVATMTDRQEAQRFWDMGSRQALDAIEAYLLAATKAGLLNVKHFRVSAQQLLALYEAEIRWGGPIGFEPKLNRRMIKRAAECAVDVFLAAYGVARANRKASHSSACAGQALASLAL